MQILPCLLFLLLRVCVCRAVWASAPFLPTFEEPPAPLPLTQQEAQQQEKVKQTIKEVQTGLGEQVLCTWDMHMPWEPFCCPGSHFSSG